MVLKLFFIFGTISHRMNHESDDHFDFECNSESIRRKSILEVAVFRIWFLHSFFKLHGKHARLTISIFLKSTYFLSRLQKDSSAKNELTDKNDAFFHFKIIFPESSMQL